MQARIISSSWSQRGLSALYATDNGWLDRLQSAPHLCTNMRATRVSYMQRTSDCRSTHGQIWHRAPECRTERREKFSVFFYKKLMFKTCYEESNAAIPNILTVSDIPAVSIVMEHWRWEWEQTALYPGSYIPPTETMWHGPASAPNLPDTSCKSANLQISEVQEMAEHSSHFTPDDSIGLI